MVIADYSGIELRILAELSDDEQLRQDVIFGNVHAENAVLITKAVREQFFERLAKKDARAVEARTRAKAFSFQLTYGASPPALAVGADYGITIVEGAPEPARKFAAYVLSPEGRRIIGSHGFALP